MNQAFGKEEAMGRPRRCIVLAVTTLALSFWTSAGWAAEAEIPETLKTEDLEKRLEETASIPTIVTVAYRRNPEIQSARDGWRAVIERYRVATGYPDPQLLSTYSPEPIETRLGPQDWSVNLTQAVPFPGRLSKAGEVVEAETQVARLELDKTVRDIIVQVRESYYELLYIEEAKWVVAQNQELVDHLRKVGETAYAQDRAALADILKAQSQVAQLEYDRLLLEDLERVEKARLNSLLNRPPEAPIGPLAKEPPHPLLYSLEETYDLASRYQEEIRIAETRIERARRRVELAGYENLPEFRFGLFYTEIGRPDVPVQPIDAGRDAVGLQAGLSIPLWFEKNRGRVGEARAELARAQSAKTARVNETFAQIRNLYFRVQNSERLVRLYRDELLPQAARAIEIAETWYREKQGSFSDFIETEAVYYNFQLSMARAVADYKKFLARLERLVGRSLTETPSAPPGSDKEGAE
ncbi:MAG: TolC family protein [Desulfobacteraceae bacterium]|nr:MAG: TolC family protein [Desulfobacteraceae bacterium]